mmetsp:Transcript_3748/g.10181  ORF Transcript_3748/g.10181 Transcript_3748/m.10181 type:complete len:81 (+) Transcript_3748:6628-6870(+)
MFGMLAAVHAFVLGRRLPPHEAPHHVLLSGFLLCKNFQWSHSVAHMHYIHAQQLQASFCADCEEHYRDFARMCYPLSVSP